MDSYLSSALSLVRYFLPGTRYLGSFQSLSYYPITPDVGREEGIEVDENSEVLVS